MAIRVPSRTRQRAYGYVKYTPVLTCPLPIQVSADESAIIVKVLGSLPLGATEVRFYFYEDGETPTLGSGYVVGTLGDDGYYGELADPEQGVLYNVIATYFGAGFESSGCSGEEAGILVDCPELLTPDNNFNYEGEEIADYDQAVTWAAVNHATGYNVYLSANGDPFELIASTTDLNYTFEGLTLGVSYRWTITAVNGDFESSGCGSRTFIGTPPGTTVEIFDEPGEYEWEINDFATSVEVRVLGGGGGGGGGQGGAGFANIVTGGGGGGGGAGIVKTFTPAELAGTIVITVGAGGSGGAGYGGNQFGDAGSPGSASKFGDLLTAGGGGGGAGGEWRGEVFYVGGGGGGGSIEGAYMASADGGTGGARFGGTGGITGGAEGGQDSAGSNVALDADAPSTDFGGGGGGGGDFNGTRGSVSLWGGPGGGGGSAAFNGLPSSEQPGANGTASTGATDTPAGGAAHSNGADGVAPADVLLLAGSSGGGGGGGNGDSGALPKNNGGDGGVGARGAGGGGGGGIYVDRETVSHPFVYHAGSGGAGGNGYVVIITTNTVP